MRTTLLAAADAAPNETGEAILGFLIIAGVIWAICAACQSKPKSYRWQAGGTITPK